MLNTRKAADVNSAVYTNTMCFKVLINKQAAAFQAESKLMKKNRESK